MNLGRRAYLCGAAAIIVLITAGCSSSPHSVPKTTATSSASSAPTTAPLGSITNPVRVAIVGDSLTAGGGSRNIAEGLDANTWMTYARGRGIDYVGGWAVGGTTVETMSANVNSVGHVDVLVIMAGTNDVRHHIEFASAAPSYDQIVKVVKPKYVIIGAIPPLNSNPDDAALYGWKLKQYAIAKSWNFVDPWLFARNGRSYAAGTSRDGIHPTTPGYRKVGEVFRASILKLVSQQVAS